MTKIPHGKDLKLYMFPNVKNVKKLSEICSAILQSRARKGILLLFGIEYCDALHREDTRMRKAEEYFDRMADLFSGVVVCSEK